MIGFSEEEGVRYRTPFLGSLAAAGQFGRALLERVDSCGISMAQAFRTFGLDPARIDDAAYGAGTLLGFIEVHIEQGPALERLEAPLGIVDTIAGQSRIWGELEGRPGHAGTTPMEGRNDALAAAAEIILAIEALRGRHPAWRDSWRTFGRAWCVERHRGSCAIERRYPTRRRLVSNRGRRRGDFAGNASRQPRGVGFTVSQAEHHAAVAADRVFRDWLAEACENTGFTPHRLVSGAGHDAGIMARVTRMAMLFLRSEGGVSHHPDERVSREDVAAGLAVLVRYLEILNERVGQLDEISRDVDPVGVT